MKKGTNTNKSENEIQQEIQSLDKEFLNRTGLDPQMVENLRSSQLAYLEMGVKMSLEEVYDFEVESPDRLPELNQPSEQSRDFSPTVVRSLIARGMARDREEALELLKQSHLS